MEKAEGWDGVADLMQAFNDDGGDVAAFSEGAESGGAVRSGGEVFGVFGGETVIQIKLLKGCLDD